MNLSTLKLSYLVLITLNCLPLTAKDADKIWVLPSFDHGGGLFHNFMNVIGFLDDCEQKQIINYKVDFGDKGHYFEKELGTNWWEYYFEPIEHKNLLVRILSPWKRTTKRVNSDRMAQFVRNVEYKMSRQRAHELITKYIKLRPELEEEVNQFTKKYFSSFHVIGIHFRGTDKIHALQGYAQAEASQVAYDEVFYEIDLYVKKLEGANYRLFVATDVQEFLDVMEKRYEGLVIATPSIRSKDGKPLHYLVENAPPLYYYMQGKEAAIDCLLLSKCHFMIKTSSNLNFCASLFNPDLEMVSLNQRL